MRDRHPAQRRALRVAAIALSSLLTSAIAHAQQRPLVTEDPETIGLGLVLIEAGVDHQRRIYFPASGLTGDLLRFPTLGISLGVGSIAEIQIDGTPFQRLNVSKRETAPLSAMLDFTGDRTTSMDDLVVGTKVRLVPEGVGRPAIAVRFATKLPIASNESGLGTDTMDFYVAALLGKTVRSVRFVGNVGVGILGDPVRGDQQNNVLTYGFSMARAISQPVEIVGEINGRFGVDPPEIVPAGTENRGTMRFGARFTQGTVRLDGGVILGMTSRDPSFGFTAGLTWVFRGFSVP